MENNFLGKNKGKENLFQFNWNLIWILYGKKILLLVASKKQLGVFLRSFVHLKWKRMIRNDSVKWLVCYFLFPWLRIRHIDVMCVFSSRSHPSQAFVDFFSQCLHEEYRSKGIFVQVSGVCFSWGCLFLCGFHSNCCCLGNARKSHS